MNKTFTTAKGIAYYPYISAPDTKFDEQGHYKVNLCLSEAEAQPVIELIKQTVVEGIKALKKDKPNMEIKQAPLPFSKELDDDGNPTGNMMTKSNIYGGSEVKVNGSCAFFHTAMIGAGVSIRLRAVQVIQYVEGASGANKFGFDEVDGFTVEEDVFTSEATPAAAAVEEAPAPTAPKVVQAIKPVEQVKPVAVPKPVEEPKAVKTVSGADDLAAEIAQLVGDIDNG